MRKFDFGTFTRKEEGSTQHQFSGGGGGVSDSSNNTPMNNNNSFPGTPAAGITNNGQLPSTTASIPKLVIEGQQPLDKKYLYSTGTVRFVGYAHTSEAFVEGKTGGINSDLLDGATARGGVDPVEAVARANQVWKERTFVVEPSKAGWTLHILKSKLGGDTTIKHSIQLADVASVDIMTSQQPGRRFQAHARTTADTQAKTHFMLDFQSYIAIAVGKQQLEITCRTPEAVLRNYTFLVNCLQATAILCRHSAELVVAEKEIDKQPISVHLRAVVNAVTGATVPIKFDCTFSLSTKPQEPHVQLRGEATIPTALFDLTAANSPSNNNNNNNSFNNNNSMGAASVTPNGANDGFGSPTNNNNNKSIASPQQQQQNAAQILGVKPGGTLKVRGKFRILLHPLNLNPPTTEEGIRVIVQSDEDHMVPVELRPIPGKTKPELTNVPHLRRCVVTIIQSMMEMGSAMSGPRLARDTANQTNGSNNNSMGMSDPMQQQQGGGASSAASLNQQQFPGSPLMKNNNQMPMMNTNMNPQQLQQSLQQLQQGPGSPTRIMNNNNNNNNSPSSPLRGGQQQQNNNNNNNNFMTSASSTSATSRQQMNNWNVLNGATRLAFLNNNNNPSFQNNNNNFRGNSVEQLESGTRQRLESSFMEMLRTLCFASMPTRGMGARMGGGASVGLSPSPHHLASQQNTSISNYYSSSAANNNDHPLATSPRFMHQHSMQRNGAVPIAVTQIANTASSQYFSPSGNNQQQQYRVVVDPATGKDLIRGNYNNNNLNSEEDNSNFVWDFRHTNTWPMMMPGDDVQDFRLHLARILKHRAGKDLKQTGTSANSNNNSNNNNAASAVINNASPRR